MIGLFLKTTIGLSFIGMLAFLGWQLYLYQKVEPTNITAEQCSELFCVSGMECKEKQRPIDDVAQTNGKPVFSCQTWIGSTLQGSFLHTPSTNLKGKKEKT
jgi:hypothetical protein